MSVFFFFFFTWSGIRLQPLSVCGATPWCLAWTPSWLCCFSLWSPWWWWTQLDLASKSSLRSGGHILCYLSIFTTHLDQTDGHLVFFSPQFFIYGGYFALISLVFFLAGLCKMFLRRRSLQAAVEKSLAGVETDSPPISGSESYLQINTASVNVNGNCPAQQRWTKELQVNHKFLGIK